MYISGGDNRLNCKHFPGTLRGVTMQWMATLLARSIQTFSDLARSFVSQFAANKIKKLKGLRVGPFSDALALRRPTSMEEIPARAEKHVEVEEDQLERREVEHDFNHKDVRRPIQAKEDKSLVLA
ncbi:hypothetical protein CR513_17148, partial [Mucuna pruriens]